jgi:hypothetical protein
MVVHHLDVVAVGVEHVGRVVARGDPRVSRDPCGSAGRKPKPGARQRTPSRNCLHRQVCDGEMKLAVAQRREARNSVKIYRQTDA